MLLARLASAALLVPIILGLVWAGRAPTVIGAALVAAWCALEYNRLLERAGFRPAWPVSVIGAAALAAAPGAGGAHLGALALAVAVLAPGLYIVAQREPLDRGLQNWALTSLGTLFVGWPLAQAVALRLPDAEAMLFGITFERGVLLLTLALTCTWASDTAAYIVGRTFGRRPFFALISPRKTQEGAIAGVLAPMVVAALWAPNLGFPLPFALVLGASAGAATVTGDLLESALKRALGAKDASQFLPGHGGMLDRVDGLLLCLVTTALLTAEAWP